MTRGPDAAEVKARTPLSQVVAPFVTWDRRKSVAARGDWWAPCPFHQERTPSFHVDDARGFYHCFGCHAGGDHFTFLAAIKGLDFKAALAYLGGEATPEAGAARPSAPPPPPRERRDRLPEAAEIWAAAIPDHPILSAYLRARGVYVEGLLAQLGSLPPTLRLHPALPYLERDRAGTWREIHRGPAMVGRIGTRGHFVGVHRTWITPEGRQVVGGRKLDKRMIGRPGAIMGQPVRFAPPSSRMVVGEGIETTLAVWSRLLAERPAEGWSADAALSLGALAGVGDPAGRGPDSPHTGRPLPSAIPDWTRAGWLAPDCVAEIVILADGSAKDPLAAQRHAERARRRHSVTLSGRPRKARVAVPGGDYAAGLDFADIARESMQCQ